MLAGALKNRDPCLGKPQVQLDMCSGEMSAVQPHVALGRVRGGHAFS